MRPLSSVLSSFACLVAISFASSTLIAPPHAAAQQAHAAAMTNDDVIGLASAGLGDDIIIAKIHAAPSTAFDTSLPGLKALKAANVSGSVIRVMIDPKASLSVAPTAASGGAAAPAFTNNDDPLSLHAPGIYVMARGADGQMHLTKLTHVNPKQGKTSGTFVSSLTYGIAKAKYKAVVDGPQATVHFVDVNPAFYAYIPEDNSTFGGTPITIQDFSLVKFDVTKDTRTVDTGSFSIWGAQNGTDLKAARGFTSEVIAPGIYKLTLVKPLPAGQFAFQQAGAAGSSTDQKNTGSYFDFGVTPNS